MTVRFAVQIAAAAFILLVLAAEWWAERRERRKPAVHRFTAAYTVHSYSQPRLEARQRWQWEVQL